jgi:hypothetical protein
MKLHFFIEDTHLPPKISKSKKGERIREHVPVLKSHTTLAGGVKRRNKNQHGGQEEPLLVRS